jgi:sugar diacid utilization regulator/putative methionine-R-sulfoxide reductase with GAF domain
MAGSRVRLFASLLERLKDRDLPPDETLQAVVDSAARAMSTEVSTLYVLDACANELILAATRGLARSGVGFVTLKMGEGISGKAALLRAPESCSDVRQNHTFKLIPGFDQSHYLSILAVPVLHDDELIGVLNVQSVEVKDYNAWDEQELSAIAGMLAPLLSHYWSTGDLALGLHGPRLLSSVDGYVAASLGPAEICEQLASGLNLMLAPVRCSIAYGEPGTPREVVGEEPPETVRSALDACMRTASEQYILSDDVVALALPLKGESIVCGSVAVWTREVVGDPPWDAPHVRHYLKTLSQQAGLALERMLSMRSDAAPRESHPEESALYADLVELVLQDRGLDEVVEQASRASGIEIGIVDAFGTPLAGHVPAEVATDLVLRAGDQVLGRMLASAPIAERPVLETAAQVISLELSKWKVRFEVEAQLRGDVLETLLSGGPIEARELQARASLVGLDMRRTYTPIMFSFDEKGKPDLASPLAVRSLIRAAHKHFGEPPNAVVFQRPEGFLVLISSSEDPLAQSEAAVQDFKALTGIKHVGTGLGTPAQDPAAYAASVRKAGLSAALGLRFRLSGPITQGRLGVHGLLLAISEPDRLQEFLAEQLGALLSWDAKTGGDLVRTLEAYHVSGERLRPAARMLYVHVNTLKYRLARIEALTGRKLHDPVDRFNMYLALYALRLAEPDRETLISDEIRSPSLSESNDAALDDDT